MLASHKRGECGELLTSDNSGSFDWEQTGAEVPLCRTHAQQENFFYENRKTAWEKRGPAI